MRGANNRQSKTNKQVALFQPSMSRLCSELFGISPSLGCGQCVGARDVHGGSPCGVGRDRAQASNLGTTSSVWLCRNCHLQVLSIPRPKTAGNVASTFPQAAQGFWALRFSGGFRVISTVKTRPSSHRASSKPCRLSGLGRGPLHLGLKGFWITVGLCLLGFRALGYLHGGGLRVYRAPETGDRASIAIFDPGSGLKARTAEVVG